MAPFLSDIHHKRPKYVSPACSLLNYETDNSDHITNRPAGDNKFSEKDTYIYMATEQSLSAHQEGYPSPLPMKA